MWGGVIAHKTYFISVHFVGITIILCRRYRIITILSSGMYKHKHFIGFMANESIFRMFTEVYGTFRLCPHRVHKASLSGLFLIVVCVRN